MTTTTTPATPTLAFHGDAQLKADLVREVAWHREQDKLVAGCYSEGENGDFRGCAVGCSLHSLFRLGRLKERTYDRHDLYESLVGVPAVIAHLQDVIFEGLPSDERAEWPERFWQAIPTGADLSLVSAHFFVWLLVDEKDGVINLAPVDKWREQHKAIAAVADLYRRRIAGDEPSDAERNEGAAWAARAAGTAQAAWAEEAYRRMADKLLELLASAPAPANAEVAP